MGGTDASSSSSAKSVARTVVQHHLQAAVGFLLGFFVVLVLYSSGSSRFGPRAAIG
jgi:hypothetical protein